jgi:hypothetical protein
VFMIFGGLVRLVANQQTFQSFMIGELWVSHPYFVYVYRVLGAFVILVGITLFLISQDPARYARILRLWGFCFLLVGCVMVVAGYLLRLSILHYAVDCIFTFILAALCLSLGTRTFRTT